MPPNKKPTSQSNCPKQWIFLMPDAAASTDSNLVKLLHPRSNESTMYMFSGENIYEISQFKEDFGSWFVEETVQQDGSLFITTPMDPVFLVLPYLIKASSQGNFSPLEQIVHDEDHPDCDRLVGMDVDLSCVCDYKGSDDFTVYRFNEEKTLEWLKKKVEKTAEILKEENVFVGPGCAVDTYVMSKKEHFSEEHYIRYGFELVSDYLSPQICDKLKNFMEIKDVKVERENVISPSTEEPPSKKQKMEGPKEDYSNVLKPLKQKQSLTASQKKLEKIDKTGMKSLTSFFAVKPKK